jgi:hypothetical protein
MWNSDDIVVNPDRVRAHAAQVESTLENVSKAKEAADYLSKADDGYGSLVGWYAGLTVGSLHDRITGSLKQIVETTETLPKTLRHCADVFDNIEASRKAEIDGQQSQIK